MQTLVERGCGLDAHQATVVVLIARYERRESAETDADLRHHHA